MTVLQKWEMMESSGAGKEDKEQKENAFSNRRKWKKQLGGGWMADGGFLLQNY